MFHCFEPLLQEFIQSNLLMQFFVVIGAYKILGLGFSVLGFFINLVYPKLDLQNRYGSNSWALVTGASDGIGKAFCFSLSKRGFNVALVGRNQEKTEKVMNELKKQYPNIKYRIVLADFTQSLKDNQFINKIVESTKDLDISILVNNVGIDLSPLYRVYQDIPIQSVIDNITVNCAPQALLSRAIIPRFLSRKSRSAVIDVSSFAGIMTAPLLELYSATKAFNMNLSRGLNQEYRSKLDFMTVTPMQVESHITEPYIKAGLMKHYIVASQFSEATLDQVGRTSFSLGHFVHTIMGNIVFLLPASIADPLAYKEMLKIKDAAQKFK